MKPGKSLKSLVMIGAIVLGLGAGSLTSAAVSSPISTAPPCLAYPCSWSAAPGYGLPYQRSNAYGSDPTGFVYSNPAGVYPEGWYYAHDATPTGTVSNQAGLVTGSQLGVTGKCTACVMGGQDSWYLGSLPSRGAASQGVTVSVHVLWNADDAAVSSDCNFDCMNGFPGPRAMLGVDVCGPVSWPLSNGTHDQTFTFGVPADCFASTHPSPSLSFFVSDWVPMGPGNRVSLTAQIASVQVSLT